MNTSLQKKIMRRVYYSYALSFAENPMLWRGAFLGAAAVLLADWLHVASIVHTFLATSVEHIPMYVTHAFVHAATHGEILTVIVFVAAFYVLLSSMWHLARQFHVQFFTVQAA